MRSEALRGGAATKRRRPRATLQPVTEKDNFSLDDSRFVRSAWVWRLFFLLSLVALGAAFIFIGNGKTLDAVLWVIIAAGWFAFAMGLWRKHTKLDQ
jgi:hypothetical protein